MFFVRCFMKIEKPNLIHIKYEINYTFYQISHENCEENENFCQKFKKKMLYIVTNNLLIDKFGGFFDQNFCRFDILN